MSDHERISACLNVSTTSRGLDKENAPVDRSETKGETTAQLLRRRTNIPNSPNKKRTSKADLPKGSPAGEKQENMAAGNAKIIRYVLFAFFGLMIIYFILSSSLPRPPLPSSTNFAKWKGRKAENQAAIAGASSELPGDASEKIVSAQSAASLNSTGVGGAPFPDIVVPPEGKMNATFVTLARNSDLWDIIESIRQVEDRFNRHYHYDWVFLNDKEFDEEFKKVTSALISGRARYGKVPDEHWSFPEWIDKEKARKVREDMAERKIIYGDSTSYRHMCRFESGFFFRQPLMMEYEWYWRVEPSIKLFCDIGFDPFRFMAENKKIYSFVLSLYEYVETIPTIWDSAKKFIKEHPEHIAEHNGMDWLSDDDGENYNHCHFWSNFEVGNLNWLRSKPYLDFFETLDKDGGFFYERWGDAPVHSIAAGLLLDRDQVHFFEDIGYWHVPFTHCPTNEKQRLDLKCSCNPKDNFDWKGYSCTNKWFEVNDMKRPEGYKDQQD